MTSLSVHRKLVRTHAGATRHVHALELERLGFARGARPVEAATPPGLPRRPGSRLWRAEREASALPRTAAAPTPREAGHARGEGARCGRAEPGSRRPRARRIAAPPAPSRGAQLSTQTEVLTSRNYRGGHVSRAWLLSATPQMLPRESRKGGRGPGFRHTLLGCPSSKLGRRRGHHPRPSGPQGSHETHGNYS